MNIRTSPAPYSSAVEPLLYALDRLFDMVRTTLNITGDAACAAVVDKLSK